VGHTSATKDGLRRTLLAARRARTPEARSAAERAIAAHAAADRALSRAARLAAYLAMPGEPPTADLIAAFLSTGTEVLVPVTRPDHRLDWVLHDPAAPTVRSALGIDEPMAEPLPGDALAEVDLVLVPALAVDHHGNRLGRGAGYYDRALAGLRGRPDRPLLCAVVFADELLPEVPHDDHDVPVDLVLTDGGVFRPNRH
jgi:5-formyltetrahydrofolate cyclo-ligase